MLLNTHLLIVSSSSWCLFNFSSFSVLSKRRLNSLNTFGVRSWIAWSLKLRPLSVYRNQECWSSRMMRKQQAVMGSFQRTSVLPSNKAWTCGKLQATTAGCGALLWWWKSQSFLLPVVFSSSELPKTWSIGMLWRLQLSILLPLKPMSFPKPQQPPCPMQIPEAKTSECWLLSKNWKKNWIIPFCLYSWAFFVSFVRLWLQCCFILYVSSLLLPDQ